MVLVQDLFARGRITSGKTVDRVLDIYCGSCDILFALYLLTLLPHMLLTVALSFTGVFDNFILLDEMMYAVFCLFAFMFVNSFFVMIAKGGIIQSVADYYAGNSRSFWKSVRASGARVCGLVCYHMLAIGICGGPIALVWTPYIFMPVGFGSDSFQNAVATLLVIASIVWIILFRVSMVAAVPIIMIEKKSALDSMEGSYNLSLGHRGYIFCSLVWLLIPVLVNLFVAVAVAQNAADYLFLRVIIFKALLALSFPLNQMYVPCLFDCVVACLGVVFLSSF